MYNTIVLLSPITPNGSALDMYVCASSDRKVQAVGPAPIEAALKSEPSISYRFWGGEFSEAGGSTAGTRLDLNMTPLKKRHPTVDDSDWAGCDVSIYYGKPGDAWPWAEMFKGKVRNYSRNGQSVQLTCQVDTEPLQADILTNRFAGTGLIEGGPDLTDRPKPLVLGHAKNVEPILINEVDNVYQFSGYGPIEAVDDLFERGSSFGASVGNFNSYAALVAANIPEARWGTCLAQGLIRLGAPQAGVITGDVRGHEVGGTTPRRVGAIIQAMASIAGISSSLIDAASLSAMDAAAPYNYSHVQSQQEAFSSAARSMAANVNHVCAVGLLGVLAANPVQILSSPSVRVDAQGRALPLVFDVREQNARAPYSTVRLGAERSWRVHTPDEIASKAVLLPRGIYSGSTFYVEGNIVEAETGSRWVYINPTPGSGNAPPVWPTTSNSHWENLNPPITATDIGVEAGATRNTGALADLDEVDLDSAQVTGELPTERASASLINAEQFEQAPSLLDNASFKILDRDGFVAGIYPVEGTSTRTAAQQLTSSGGLRITSAVDATVAYGFPAIPIDDRKIYTLRIRHRSSAASSDGLYVRFNERSSALANGRTHVSSGEIGSHGSDRTGFVDLVADGAMPGTAVREDTYTYTPTPGTKFASFSMYNWSGFGGEYEVYWASLSEQGNHAIDATRNTGALSNLDRIDLADLAFTENLLPSVRADGALRNSNQQWSEVGGRAADGEFTRALALATMNFGGLGDITFSRNVAGTGSANNGEIRLNGTTFFPVSGGVHLIDQTRREIPTPYEGSRVGNPFFVIYSEQSVTSRFSGFWNNTSTALNFFTAEYNEITRQWTARDNAYVGYNFTPLETDCIVAVCEKRNTTAGIDSVSSLLGVNRVLPTVQRGATSENLFFDNFDDYEDEEAFFAEWQPVSGSGEIIFNTSGVMPGGSHLSIGTNAGNDERWLVHRNARIPYDPDALYEIEFVVRQWQGAGTVYLGVTGFAEDKTTRENITGTAAWSSQHYVAASNFDLANQDVIKMRGYFKGRAASGNGGQHNNPADPATLHDDVDFFSPMIIANYQGEAGRLDVASCRVRKVSIETINPATGRIFDPRAYNTQAILGPRNTTNLNPTYTAGGSNVTVNLPSHLRRIAGLNGPISLSYGSSSGVVAFDAYWAAYLDDADLSGFGSPSVTFTSNPDNLLFANRYQLASGIAPSSSGTGGGTGTGGGGGGGFDNCVSEDAWVEVLKPSRRSVKCGDDRNWIKARHVVAGDHVRSLVDGDPSKHHWRLVLQNYFAIAECTRIEVPSGAFLDLASSTPITQPDGSTIAARDIEDGFVGQFVNGEVEFTRCSAEPIGEASVAHISCGDGTYLAGMEPGRAIFSHNNTIKP